MEQKSLLKKIKAQHILIIGDLLLDEYILGNCSRLSPEAPVPIIHASGFRSTLGGAANTAANIVALGAKATLIGIIGNDESGRQLRATAKAEKIYLRPILDGRPTIKKTRILGQKQQLLRIDFEETHAMDKRSEQKTLLEIKSQIAKNDLIIFSDYAKGVFSKSLCQKALQAAHQAKKRVIIDPRPNHASFYKSCDYITPNWSEALQLISEPGLESTDTNIKQVAEEIRTNFKTNVLLTLGPKGLYFLSKTGKESFLLPTESLEVFDVSGAGDTVAAVFALGLASGLSHNSAVRLANKAAGIVVGKMGTAVVTPDELFGIDPYKTRIISRNALEPLSKKLKSQGKKVVTINGSFDLLHNGHVHILREAKSRGDVLLVGLNSDTSVKKYKGKDRPMISEKQRAEMLLALECVDYVHIFNESVPMPFIKKIKPHVHANGSEYGMDCIEAETVKKNGGEIYVVEKIKGFSTSEIINKIRKLSN
ncbi:MAG: bifunctional heptose 7-phosphate kinase/heptose 1-phosphate adenyltransferase [Fibrobacteria bacterium]|nr:bifunctional heptose 7-phosphate kinase/heptose 1-phosphate adenyltransferase [Fibrobacteria bacterium]